MIQSWFSSLFPRRIRERGAGYSRQGRVTLVEINDHHLLAEVRGTRPYRVELTRGKGTVRCTCACPHAETGQTCKHIWATILTAELDPDGNDWLLESLPEGADTEEDSAEGRFGGGTSEYTRSSGATSQPGQRKTPPDTVPRVREPSWRRHFDRLAQRAGLDEAASPPAQVPASVRYRLYPDLEAFDPEDPEPPTHAGLSVEYAFRKKNGELGVWRQFRLDDAELQAVAPEDRAILSRLRGGIDAWSRYHYAHRSDLPTDWSVSPEVLETLGPQMAATGKLWLGDPQSADPPARLSWDDGPPWSLRIRIRQVNANGDAIAGATTGATTGAPADPPTDPPTDEPADPAPDAPAHAGTRTGAERYVVRAAVHRDGEEASIDRIDALLAGPFVHLDGRVARLGDLDGIGWLVALAEIHGASLPLDECRAFVEMVMRIPTAPAVDAPKELAWRIVEEAPRPCLHIHLPANFFGAVGPMGPVSSRISEALARRAGARKQLVGEVGFDYRGVRIDANEEHEWVPLAEQRMRIRRHQKGEGQAFRQLRELGFRRSTFEHIPIVAHDLSQFARLVRRLIGLGWHVEAEGRRVQSPLGFYARLNSRIDWFDLEGAASYRMGDGHGGAGPEDGGAGGTASAGESGDGATFLVRLPELLSAAQSDSPFVRLEDGSIGLLPEGWLDRYAALAELGIEQETGLRFRSNQAALLEALLADKREVQVDDAYAQARERLRSFDKIEAIDVPAGFRGTLRPYQRDSLSWFEFLRTYGFGGCLADDMGLGKTVMVLALLERCRTFRGREPRPSLIVVPRSLVFNWLAEAKRFAPKLHMLDYTGPQRGSLGERVGNHHIVVTTYGTVRREVHELSEIPFDYVILDEAQAIKNHRTSVSKAVKLLESRHRLALSGTPIENRLLELWSLFEFLNPGMLGSERSFQELAAYEPVEDEVDTDDSVGTVDTVSTGSTVDTGARRALEAGDALEAGTEPPSGQAFLSRAVRPFVLRRTKSQVVRDLPPKTEQTVFCELTKKQRKQYDELRAYYQAQLRNQVNAVGWNRAKFLVVEALLRLRQAACHSGLVDPARTGEPSAKVELALDRIGELAEEGHKVLVFSQFTKFLAIVREKLETRGIVYEYLDGRTRKRSEHVERFQTDPEITAFLISLKAGGVGLNLTAAEHVILLDPWWNPAVEAQAIDRAHRIGQTKPVLAWRIVARDTVEERILELQAHKRSLADAIIQADKGLVKDLRREDLETLLG